MENNQSKIKIRNPFPWIYKVFKYEMKHSMRILLPVYAAIIVIALLAGILIKTMPENSSVDFSFTTNVNGVENALNQATGFAIFLYGIILIASAVVSVIIIKKRFNNGLLGDEAYLNLALPVSMGEHILGRILSILVWSLVYAIVMLLSLFAISIRFWKELFENLNLNNSAYNFFAPILAIISFGLLLCLFIYLINAIGHLSKKHRTLVKILTIIILMSITSKFFAGMSLSLAQKGGATFYDVLYSSSLFALILSVIYGISTYFILKLKLNLE